MTAGWPGSRWRLDRGTAVVLVVVLAAAAAVSGFLLLRRPAAGGEAGVAVPGSAPVVSGVPVAGSTSATMPSGSPSPWSGLPAGLPSAVPSASSGDGRLRVYVIGQVKRPGVVTLPAGSRVEDAVDAAGGATRKADLTAVNLARPVADGEQVYLPRPGEEPPVAAGPGPSSAASVPGAAAGPLDLNAATLAQLDELPGVGPVLAQRILEYRQQRGRFAAVDELGDVSGIGDATLEKLRPLVRA